MTIINPDHPAGRGLPKLYSSEEVADMLGISARQVTRLRQSGKLKSVRVTGAAVRHTLAQVEAFIEERSNDAR